MRAVESIPFPVGGEGVALGTAASAAACRLGSRRPNRPWHNLTVTSTTNITTTTPPTAPDTTATRGCTARGPGGGSEGGEGFTAASVKKERELITNFSHHHPRGGRT
ncbi:hypothetical protein E2C01_101613 [Portunus trituberculatus]|uniref:Uncharacterized protein n=1 Tax=Portunus trituberculatus TaxID=210409 RepID=A0A5B7KGA9_PORTR|nr:hypothetical protein [Portunus trituberculatus]